MSHSTTHDVTPVAPLPAPGFQLRSGPIHWIRSYWLMVRWELMSLRLVFPIMVVVQIFMGAGLVVGFGLLFDEIPHLQAIYLSTGSTVVSMLVVGLAMAPQLVAQQKMAKTYDFMWSLPVPRMAQAMANTTVWVMVTIPGVILTLLVANWRFDLDLHVQVTVVPAILLTVLVATSVGLAFAHALPNPMITAMITQVLVFVILLFSPINFPPERLPQWLQSIHRFLPFQHAANVIRGSLTDGIAQNVGESFLVLVAWGLAGWTVTAWVLVRRK
jgi:ABC-2 type transport system permease protein